MEKQISIIDHVGTKAGIDFYSLSMLQGLENNDVIASYYSDQKNTAFSFHSNKTFFFQSHSNPILKLIGFTFGYSLSLLLCMIRGERNVLFHSFSYTTKDFWLVVLLLAGQRKLFTIAHDVDSLSPGDKFWIKKFILKKCTRIMVHNEYSKKEIEKLNITEISNKTVVIPHGHFNTLNKQQLEKSEAHRLLQLDSSKIYLLFFGQIKPVKGLSLLIEALSLLPEKFHLIIAGKPQYSLSEINNRLQELNLSNRIKKDLRYITNKERNVYFSAADASVLPYTKIYQSGVLLMSMSYGIPPVTSDLPAFKEIISNTENGMLFQSENANDLAEKITELFSQENRYHSIRKNALKTMQMNHDWNSIALQFKSKML